MMLASSCVIEAKRIGEGITRKILAHGPELMTCEFSFDEGAVLDPHSHPHAQSSLVISGSMQFDIDGKTLVLNAGDNLFIPPNVAHGGKALCASVIVDSFTPRREDFLK